MKLPVGTIIRARGLLFDMDGTLVDSTPAIERVWTRWANRHGLEPQTVLAQFHGVRIADTVARLAPDGIDHQGEVQRLLAEERDEVEGISAVPGAVPFVESMRPNTSAVVTSADRKLAQTRLSLAGFSEPEILIAAEDVANGKPLPDGYLLAARTLDLASEDLIVFEDSAPGLEAGRAAGCRTLAIAATLPHAPAAEVDWVEDFRSLTLSNGSPEAEYVLEVIR